jgi:hypothetical protein
MNSDSDTAVDDVTIDDLTYKFLVVFNVAKTCGWHVTSTHTLAEAEAIRKDKLAQYSGAIVRIQSVAELI